MNDKDFDSAHIWHPYSSLPARGEIYEVDGAYERKIVLTDGTELIDGMASWWSVIHGYNNPVLQKAVCTQANKLSHVMFGGLRHAPATRLARMLVKMTPKVLDKVFFADSGSVAVEVALKLALQYQIARGRTQKTRILSLEGAYHGDTIGAISVCDPENSMHSVFSGILPGNIFTLRPSCKFADNWNDNYLADVTEVIEKRHTQIAAFILEPIVQGAGGMYFYNPEYINGVKALCDRYDIVLIFDEIATGFGRTGKLFALEYTDVTPDILCLGKAMTGGMLSMAAVLTTAKISDAVSKNPPYAFMHGPTFMANPLACAAAIASIDLLLKFDWRLQVKTIERTLQISLLKCKKLKIVKEVRVLGAIGVVELKKKVQLDKIQPEFVKHGVWIRPFTNLVYVMPAYTITKAEIKKLADAIYKVVSCL